MSTKQLTWDDMARIFAGKDHPSAHVELVRLHDDGPETVYEGPAQLYIQWSDYRGRRKLKPQEPRTLGLVAVADRGWAEYCAEDAAGTGDLINEDYLMRVYAIDSGEV